MALPLEPYTLIDLTRARSGPTCVRQLAEMGAKVIKVENKGEDDCARDGFDFQNLHRNKRSITLDLKNPRGVEVLKRLAARADVLVENYRPDVKHRLGIDYETLSKVNPRLVYGSISGFGQSGPYRDRPGYDQIAQGMGGLMSITGLPGQGPVRVGIPVADLTAGMFLAHGILVALLERERSGRGQWVHTSLLEAMVRMLDFQASRWTLGKEIPPQAGNDHPTGIPTGVFKTSDGHINIAASGQVMDRRLRQAVGAEPARDAVAHAGRGTDGVAGHGPAHRRDPRRARLQQGRGRRAAPRQRRLTVDALTHVVALPLYRSPSHADLCHLDRGRVRPRPGGRPGRGTADG